MSNKMRYRYGPVESRSAKKTGTVAIEIGDMIRFTSSGKIIACSASGNCTSLVGIAMSASPATDATATTVRYAEIGHGTVFSMTVASATQTLGQGYVISAAQTLLKYSTLSFATATNVVAVCVADLDTAGTSVLVAFKAGMMNKDIATS